MERVYRACGGEGAEILPFMAAIEMIHTSSLIHDDLPAMDGDTLRRGRPTTWVTYGEDMAVLAGDGLMIYAFETAEKALDMGADPKRVARAMGVLARETGIYGMIGGQTADVYWTGKPLTEELLTFIYENKTGALVRACAKIGAIMAGAGEELISAAVRMADCVGFAFQIRDDILDITADEATLGKNVGSDERNQKTTYVSLHGLKAAQEAVEAYSRQALDLLGSFPGDTGELEAMVRRLATREK